MLIVSSPKLTVIEERFSNGCSFSSVSAAELTKEHWKTSSFCQFANPIMGLEAAAAVLRQTYLA
jgi:hypothetical protein